MQTPIILIKFRRLQNNGEIDIRFNENSSIEMLDFPLNEIIAICCHHSFICASMYSSASHR